MDDKLQEWLHKLNLEREHLLNQQTNQEFNEEISGRIDNIDSMIEQIEANRLLR